jgi:hypothetical protein
VGESTYVDVGMMVDRFAIEAIDSRMTAGGPTFGLGPIDVKTWQTWGHPKFVRILDLLFKSVNLHQDIRESLRTYKFLAALSDYTDFSTEQKVLNDIFVLIERDLLPENKTPVGQKALVDILRSNLGTQSPLVLRMERDGRAKPPHEFRVQFIRARDVGRQCFTMSKEYGLIEKSSTSTRNPPKEYDNQRKEHRRENKKKEREREREREKETGNGVAEPHGGQKPFSKDYTL